jgi:fibronectin-binding autotransporter adhesin
MKRTKSLTFLFLCAVSVPLASRALDGDWNVDANGNWNDVGNWLGGTVASGADFTATFPNIITANRTITLNAPFTIGNISALDTSHDFSISGANTLTLDRTDATKPTINVSQSGRLLTISSVIAGSDGLRKTGAGELVPSAANTFTGGIELNAGRIRIFDDANEQSFLGNSANVLTFTGNAELYNANNQVNLPQSITINGGVVGTIGGAFGERTVVAGVVGGSGTMVVQGYSAGFDVELHNTGNTFTGPIEIRSGDSVTLGVRSLLDSPAATTIGLQSNSNNGGAFEYMSGATSPAVFNNRQFELIVNGSGGYQS